MTENFRRQHEELFTLGTELAGMLTPDAVRSRGADVRKTVARFGGKLKIHARMENDALYPRLLAHPDAAVSNKANELFVEVGALYGAFDEYLARWPKEAMEADPTAFIRDTMRLLKVLGRRMMRENIELYPLADALADVRPGTPA